VCKLYTTDKRINNNNNKQQVRRVQAMSSGCTDNGYRRSIAGSGRHETRSLPIRESLMDTRDGHRNTELRSNVLSTGFGVKTAQVRRRHPVESGETMTQTGAGNRRHPVERETRSRTGTGKTGDTRQESRNTSTWTNIRMPETPGRSRGTPRPGLIDLNRRHPVEPRSTSARARSGRDLAPMRWSCRLLYSAGDSPTWRIAQVGYDCERDANSRASE